MMARVTPHFTPTKIADLTLRVNTNNAWNRFAVVYQKLPA